MTAGNDFRTSNAFRRAICVALLSSAGLVLCAGNAVAQIRKSVGPAPKGTKAAPAPSQAAPAARPAGTATTGTPQDPNALPPNFEPPGQPNPLLNINKPLLTAKQAQDLRREVGNYPSTLRNGVLDAQSRAQLPKIATLVIHQLSMPENREKLPDLVDKLMRDINQAAILQKNPQVSRQFRQAFLKEIAARSAELLDNNLHVRLQGVIILGSLYVVEPTRDNEGEAYLGSLDPLVQVLEDKTQPAEMKILAAKGLERIAATARPSAAQKLTMSRALIRELEQTDTHRWYQMRLAETLGSVDYATDDRGRPTIASALTAVVADNNRHCLVRSQAARSLGRIPLDAQVNVGNVAFSVAHFASQMAEEYNNDPGAPHWRNCYWNVYLAFKPLTTAERSRDAGLLAKVEKAPHTAHKSAVNDAYQQMLPLARHAINAASPARMPEANLTSLAEWLTKNQPVDYRVAPNTPPIATQQVSKDDQKPAG